MLFNFCRSLLLFCGAMQQAALPQNAKSSYWRDTVSRIRTLEDEGNLPEATKLAERLVVDLRRIDPANSLFPEALDKAASLQRDQGQYADAERLYQTAVELWQRRPDSPNTGLATELNNLASLYSEIGQIEKAETARRQSLTLRLHLLGPKSSEVALSYSNLASDALRQGNYEESEKLAHQANKIWLQGPPSRCQIDLAYNTLAMIQLHAGNYSSALRLSQLALQTYYQRAGKDRARLAGYQQTLALAREHSGDAKGAAQAFQDSLALIAGPNMPRSFQRIGLLRDYATLLRSMGHKSEARKMRRQASKEGMALLEGNDSLKYSVDVRALLNKQP